MKRIFLIAVMAVALSACSNSNDAVKALEAQGFTEIKTTGWSPFACSDDDTFSTGFEATNPQGKRVSGTVCSGLIIKGSTIRW